jgi:hypothetical protein
MPGGVLYTLRRAVAYVTEHTEEGRPLPPARLSPAGRAAAARVTR